MGKNIGYKDVNNLLCLNSHITGTKYEIRMSYILYNGRVICI